MTPRDILTVCRILLAFGCISCERPTSLPMRVLDQPVALIADSALYDARDVRPAANGGWWVLADHEPFVRRYDAAGTLLRHVGRRGRGPTDLLTPWTFVDAPRVEEPPPIWDVGRHALLRVDSIGRATAWRPLRATNGSVRADIRNVTFGEPFQARAVGERLIYAAYGTNLYAGSDLLRPVLLSRSSDDRVDTLASFRNLEGRRRTIGSARLLVPVPLWDICPDSTLVTFDGVHPILTYKSLAHPGERTVVIAGGPPEPAELSDRELRTYVRHRLLREALEYRTDTAIAESTIDRVLSQFKEDFPKVRPRFVRLLCDSRANIWLQRFDLQEHPVGYGRHWLIVDPQGRAQEVQLAPRFLPVLITNDMLLGIWENTDGARVPARIALSSPGP